MKKIILILSLVCFITPAFVSAQYSTASLNGPWITLNGPNITYIIFDGAGTINQLGTADDSLQPVGTYSVSGSGQIYASLNLVQGTDIVIGQMLNDSSADLLDTVQHQSMYMYKVLNTAALAGTWAGEIYDSAAHYSRMVHLAVNSSGVIVSATGITGLIAGHIYTGRDTFAGYITSTDDSCSFKVVQIAGLMVGDSLIGGGRLGQHNSNCQTVCYLKFGPAPTGITTISTIDFSVYPNPFTDKIEISVNSPAGNIQANLYDLYGRKVLSRSLSHDPAISIDASTLSAGMYMLTLTDSYGITSTERVIKK